MKRTKSELLSNTTNVKNSKFVDNNTLSIEYNDGTKAIRLHNTDVVKFVNNTIVLSSGGWRTSTTKERINKYSGLPCRLWQKKGLWYIGGSLFYDGITFDVNGKLLTEAKESNLKAVEKMKKRISKFCSLITEKRLPYPDMGDCWYCSMQTENKQTLGDATNDHNHLLEHLKEGYLHGSLLVNAMKERGYTEHQIAIHYQMKWVHNFKRAARLYLTKRLIKDIAC